MFILEEIPRQRTKKKEDGRKSERQAQWKTNIYTNFLLLCVASSVFSRSQSISLLPTISISLCIIDILSQRADTADWMKWFAFHLNEHYFSMYSRVNVLFHCLSTEAFEEGNNLEYPGETRQILFPFISSKMRFMPRKEANAQMISHVKHDSILFLFFSSVDFCRWNFMLFDIIVNPSNIITHMTFISNAANRNINGLQNVMKRMAMKRAKEQMH